MMIISGPIHLAGIALIAAGIFARIYAFVKNSSYILIYIYPLGLTFLSMWLFNSYMIASTLTWSAGKEEA
jgi:hypothetical protein